MFEVMRPLSARMAWSLCKYSQWEYSNIYKNVDCLYIANPAFGILEWGHTVNGKN